MTRAELIVEREQLQKKLVMLEVEIQQLKGQLNWFKEQFHLAKHRQFGSSSEKTVLQSELVFNEAEGCAD